MEEFNTRLQDMPDSRNVYMLIVMEDMNAKVGSQNWDYERVMCSHGLGENKTKEEGFVKCPT